MQNKLATAFITLTAIVVGIAPTAYAAPSGTESAAETIEDLRAQGYDVRVNGNRTGPLSNCSVDAVRKVSSDTPGPTVYVDLSCPAEYRYRGSRHWLK